MRMSQDRVRIAVILAAVMASLSCAQGEQDANPIGLPCDADIRRVLVERVDAIAGQEDGIGIAVGLIGPRGRRVISYGHLDKRNPRPVDANTCFEIGSVTKVFTALLLADMVRKQEVALTEPVATYLPAGLKIPKRNRRAITLLDLATHTSGLPFMPDKSLASSTSTPPGDPAVQFYEFLARYQLPRDVGVEWDYSNIGYWLLSQALASRAGKDYGSLLEERIIAPLALTRTALTPSPTMKANFAVGHDAALQPSPAISSVPVYRDMAAAGGLVSTTNDLLTFLAATMGYERSSLAPSIATVLGTRRPMSRPGEMQALGWVLIGGGNDQLIVHDGGTLGYASSVAWDPTTRVGVVVLSNHVGSVDDIARHLLRPSSPLKAPPKRRTEIALDSAVLDRYTGRYEARGEGAFVVAREHDFLTIQLPDEWGLPTLRLRPEGLRDFFVAELPLRVTFQMGSDGRVNGALVYPPRGQKAVPANRVSSGR